MRRIVKVIVAILTLAGAALLINYVAVHRHLAGLEDPRNEGVSAWAHYRYLVDANTLVFDLRDVDGTKSAADVFRVLLQFAETQKDRTYSDVILACRGQPRFVLKGAYFQQLGREYGPQNPVYTMRTFPENVYRPDGSRAFGTWTGGVIGVMGKQIEEFTAFHRQWYLEQLATR